MPIPDKAKLLDNVARFAGDAVGLASGASHSIRTEIKSRVTEAVDRLDLVPREDLERIELLLQNSLKEQEDLKLRIEKLEAKCGKKK